ncbi:Hint domain-containing protein [Thioclava litoralis]|uniref:Hint domain-containing protein n=1 Tax=Thioclava litoralis TaxID=3076557 RepID=A0ABZ1DYB8_9RHOB|nr:Hint domain-containing protein [Thioclava sp. FTW29]
MDMGYPISAIIRNRDEHSWMLRSEFQAEEMLEILFEGDVAVLRDPDGNALARGLLTADIPVLLESPEGTLRLDRIEIDGQLCLYIPSLAMVPGQSYTEASQLSTGGRAATPEEISNLPCLAGGTLIATDEGPQPIDWLRPGDRVLTRDNGYQPLLWLGHHTMPRRAPIATRLMSVSADLLGPNLPERELIITPRTGVLLAGPELELWFAETEMLAQADHLATQTPRLEGRRMVYSLLFTAPELVLAEGLWVATVQADSAYMSLMPPRVRTSLAPQIGEYHDLSARVWLADWEADMFCKDRRRRQDRIAA